MPQDSPEINGIGIETHICLVPKPTSSQLPPLIIRACQTSLDACVKHTLSWWGCTPPPHFHLQVATVQVQAGVHWLRELRITNTQGYARNQAQPTMTKAKSTTESLLHNIQCCPISYGQALLSLLKILAKINRLQASKMAMQTSQVFTWNRHALLV